MGVFVNMIAQGVAQATASSGKGVEEMPMNAVGLIPPIPTPVGPWELTNSSLAAIISAILIVVVAHKAMSKATLRPNPLQNFVEWLIESLYGGLESILGPVLTRKTFWLFATLFIFILVSNWLGLFPGVGSIGFGHDVVLSEDNAGHVIKNFEVTKPFLRGANADTNMTFAMASVFFVFWLIWSLQINGLMGFLNHIFGAKGGQKGVLGAVLAAVFLVVGVIELISIAVRPISLTFRLFGNIYGGEYMIDTMMKLVPSLSWLIPLPVYFFELLVGLVQALVFCLLTAVFTSMMCRHDDSAEHKEKAHH